MKELVVDISQLHIPGVQSIFKNLTLNSWKHLWNVSTNTNEVLVREDWAFGFYLSTDSIWEGGCIFELNCGFVRIHIC